MAHIPGLRYGTICLLVVLCALSAAVAETNSPVIAVDKLQDDFGDVHAGLRVEKKYVVSNQGNAPLLIKSVRTSCGCTTAVSESQKVLPGEKTRILVWYDTAGLSAGKKTQAVIIHSNDPKRPVTRIRIFANVKYDISLDPPSLIKQIAAFHNKVNFSLVARNASEKPIVLKLATIRGAIVKAELTPEHVRIEPASETHFTLEVTLPDQEERALYPGSVPHRHRPPYGKRNPDAMPDKGRPGALIPSRFSQETQ